MVLEPPSSVSTPFAPYPAYSVDLMKRSHELLSADITSISPTECLPLLRRAGPSSRIISSLFFFSLFVDFIMVLFVQLLRCFSTEHESSHRLPSGRIPCNFTRFRYPQIHVQKAQQVPDLRIRRGPVQPGAIQGKNSAAAGFICP
ncbi:hypothetical protein GQ43DRAFT_108889 [Delitschia confertaspora ATCC 74209]|uniref:Uncharacterized protein n=1 Tax=Delitschia confertaspora ATCC 74209 TaxID=1513339 RepID=A0A9P4JM30_9PLEO|nr:hypothetical protein GQ43DRAFT_108889 [Delitschia confertaspora ATCC 74209]